MGPLLRLISLILVLGTWWVMSDRQVETRDLRAVAGDSTQQHMSR